MATIYLLLMRMGPELGATIVGQWSRIIECRGNDSRIEAHGNLARIEAYGNTERIEVS